MSNCKDYIGVFDSGVGGISVLRQLKKLLPNERFLYYGDSANAPYGNRTTKQVQELTLAATEKILSYGIKALVVACNTATAAAIDLLRQKYPQLIIVGIEPAIKPAADRFSGGTVGIMATSVTLQEEKLDSLLQQHQEKANFIKIPAPGLVELIESGKGDSPETDALLQKLFAPHLGNLDAVVLGCTHYPLATNALTRVLGSQVCLLDGGEGTARETKRRLEQSGLLHEGSGEILWVNSLNSEEVLALSKQFLTQP